MEKEKEDKNTRSRPPHSRTSSSKRDGRRRSRSPLEVSNDTQRNEGFLKRSRLFVGNIETNVVNRSNLFETFSRYGGVVAISIHNGYAFIQMDSEKNANAAINLENNRNFNGKPLHVEFCSAAIKAGARCNVRRISFRSSRSPPRVRSRSPPIRSRSPILHVDYDTIERERRFTRIQALEHELQQEMTYLDKEPLDYNRSYRSSRRSPEPLYPMPSYDRSFDRPRGDYPSSREQHARDTRQKPTRNDYYGTQRLPPLSPPRGGVAYADYNQRESSSYRGSGYGRDWEDNRRSSYPSYPSGSGKHDW